MTTGRDADRAAAERLIDVSRETWDRLDLLVGLLDRWQAKTNLVAPNTLDVVWSRHIADSAQLATIAPQTGRWIDLGSGGGFPGLVLAAALHGRTRLTLVESNLKKAAFLREAARAMGLEVDVRAIRAEQALVQNDLSEAGVVSARALASLKELLQLAAPLLKTGAIGVFPKGKEAAVELTEASKSWKFEASLIESRTDDQARIVRIDRFDGAR